LVHCIFSTKERRETIRPEGQRRLWAYVGGIARKNGFQALAVGGTTNHVHCLLALPGTMWVAKAVQLIKGGSSKWMHDTFGVRLFEWQDGYGAFSVSRSHLKATVEYIENQERHHSRRTFEEEYVAILKKHGLAVDEYTFG
jgi:REP element-mobilizing transposase RayT